MDIYDISIRQMQYFIEVASCQSFTVASQKLYISQPTLSKWIGIMEKQLGVKLFHRKSRGVELTEAGISLYQHWTAVNDIFTKSLEDIMRMHGDRAILRIGVLRAFEHEEIISELIRKFTELYSGIDVLIELMDLKELRINLLQGNVDMAISFEFDFDDENVTKHRLKRIDSGIVLPESHRLASKDYISPEEISGEVFYSISQEESFLGVKAFFEICHQQGIIPGDVRYVSSFSSLAMNLLNGNGLAIGSPALIGQYGDKLKLIPWEEPISSYLSVIIRNTPYTSYSDLFVNMIESMHLPNI